MICPICKSTGVPEFRPFCSRRCADLDLGRWVTGAYVIPEPLAGEEDDDPTAAARDATREDR